MQSGEGVTVVTDTEVQRISPFTTPVAGGVQVYRSLNAVPLAPSVVTIGTFDGVHRGHQMLIGAVTERARTLGVRSVVITFDPHPRTVLQPENAPPRITAIDDEIALIAALGVDVIVVHPFTRETANTTAHDFMASVAQATQPVAVLVGDDFAFGRGREGTLEVIDALGTEFGYRTEVVPRIRFGDAAGGEVIGSTAIRRHVQAGDVAAAAHLLGRLFAVRGPVIHGLKRGRQIGFPTANVRVPDGVMIPCDGIYATWVRIEDDPTPPALRRPRYPAMTYIGPSPTFDDGRHGVEPNLIHWDGDLYGRVIAVEFVAWLRGDMKFDGVASLIAQMRHDQARTLDVLADVPDAL